MNNHRMASLMSAYNKNLETEIFALAQHQYENIVTRLMADDLRKSEIGSVETLLKTEGFELLRCLLQGYLDLRTQEETQHDSVIGTDDLERTHKRHECPRQLATLFGTVTVRRTGYGKPGVPSLFPLDAALNLPADKYSQGLRNMVAEAAAKESFDNAVRDIREYTAGKVPKRQAELLVQQVSQDFDAYYAQHESEELEQSQDLVVITTDAKGIVVRHEDLREATRKAAEKQQHKKKTRLSRGEKANRKRMAQVASVYSLPTQSRTVEDIMEKNNENALKRPKARNKRVWASLEKDPKTVISELFDEASRRDPEQKRQWVALIDGQETQMKNIVDTAKARDASLVIVMDFIHVLEYLWKAAYALLGETSSQVEDWVKTCATMVLQSKTSSVARIMRTHATKQGLASDKRKAVDTCADYLLKNKQYLDYKTALERGWPIATGIIEGACRHLIKDRMDITGARWSLPGAEAVLKLRAIKSSGDMVDYLEFHNRHEKQRVHDSQFQDIDALMAA